MTEAVPLAIQRFHHFGLRVADARACRDWYVETFGLVSVLEFSIDSLDFVLLGVPGDTGAALEFVGGGSDLNPAPFDTVMQAFTQLGAAHVSLQVQDLAAIMAKVHALDITIGIDVTDAPPNTLAARVAFITDPWGNIIELLQA